MFAKKNYPSMSMLLLFAACAGAPRDEIQFNVRPQKDDARIEVKMEHKRAILEVFSASGIGGAELAIISPARPQRMVMRFHLRGLEEFRFAFGETVITASVSSNKEHEVHQSRRAAGAPAPHALMPGSPDWMPIKIVPQEGALPVLPLQHGYIEVEAPPSFFQSDHRQMSLHWIDFFR